MMAATAMLAAAFNVASAPRDSTRRPAARFATGAASVVLMIAGMFAGGWLAPDAAALVGTRPGFGPLVIGMVLGMAAALIAAAIARALNAATARPRTKAGSVHHVPVDHRRRVASCGCIDFCHSWKRSRRPRLCGSISAIFSFICRRRRTSVFMNNAARAGSVWIESLNSS